MILRKNLLPRRVSDALTTLFVIVMIPTVYYFEIFIVLPRFYMMWSFWHIFHCTLGTYILWNIVTNFVALQLCDTSIRGRLMPSNPGKSWRFCSVCESFAPPRSWHCQVCDVCILKRDHHCIFISYCIGHDNLRYFIMFVLYMFIATVYASYYNLMFIWEVVPFDYSWKTLFKIIFPFAVLFIDFTHNQAYVVVSLIIIIGAIFCGVLLFYHTSNMLKAQVTKERNKSLNEYDRGVWNNIKDVLGDKWYLVWLSPFIKSSLDQDGINWITKNSDKAK
ncbi:probable palmitoyltransferase ZDHHC24 [Aethina tumida]|uniref:probable palmitoyltransferase ZDHHC24 n=1 Tax=Aethina tumida TaxID=116153 RepID=UPI00096B5AC3|nr:probable palmitoyltransferase ZDHHC24 [Aethina tumida]